MKKLEDKIEFYKLVYDVYILLHQTRASNPIRNMFRKANDSYEQHYIYSLLCNEEYGVARYIKTKDLFSIDYEKLDKEILINKNLLAKVFNHYKFVPKNIDLSHNGKYGYLYILKNKGMPGLLKVGYTCTSAFERAKQLSNTSVAYPFEVCYLARVRKPEKVEKDVHNALRDLRVNSNREFFCASVDQIIEAVENCATYLKHQDSSQRFEA